MIKKKGDGELAFRDWDRALLTAENLLEEEYIVMLSREEDLIIINYMWEPLADRNRAVFVRLEEHEGSFVDVEAYKYLDEKLKIEEQALDIAREILEDKDERIRQLEQENVESSFSLEEFQ